ncbi:hypothetical protein L0156_28105 [bacterium]|nr:hypothetical protein [bacterium]
MAEPYGFAAHRTLLNLVNPSLLFESLLSDGDVGPNWEYYCIAIESNDISRLHQITVMPRVSQTELVKANTRAFIIFATIVVVVVTILTSWMFYVKKN